MIYLKLSVYVKLTLTNGSEYQTRIRNILILIKFIRLEY